jgi:hypothetical protein
MSPNCISKQKNILFVLVTGMLLAHSAVAQSWTSLAPSGTLPVARGMNGAPGVYDPASDRLIVFGGRDGNGTNHNDVWVLQNADGLHGASKWIRLIQNGAAGSPPARSGHSTVYDAANNRLIVFGGCGGSCVPALNDVWVLTNANGLGGTPAWTQLSPNAGPSPRTSALAAYDPARNWLIVFGGQDGSPNACSVASDAWVLSNANGLGGTPAWSTSASTPPYRTGAASMYDPGTGTFTAFGGMSLIDGDCVPTNAVWTINTKPSPLSNSWQFLSPDAVPPAPRSFASAVYDPAASRMLVFGGEGASANYLSDVWSLSNPGGAGTPMWNKLSMTTSSPDGRSGHVAAYASASRRMIIFGGANAGGVLNDAWVLTAPGVSGLSCSASAVPNIVSAEGVTERMGDVVLKCTGGTPTPEGESIPEYTINYTLNTDITSRQFPEGTDLSEALLIIDDAFPAHPIPSSATPGPSAPPQIVCAPLGSNCTEKGTGGSPSPYQTQPNVFAATQVSSSLQWKVPIDAPGVNNTRTIRLTNVLADAENLGLPAGINPVNIKATIQVQPTLKLSGAQKLEVASSVEGVEASVTPSPAIPQCTPHNAVLLGKTGPAAAFDFSVQLRETFISEFQYRNYGTALHGPEVPPAIVEQNVPGFPYFTETGVYSPSLFTAAPTLGLADTGTRIRISLGSIASGTALFVPTNITLTGGYGPGGLPGELQLVQANLSGRSTSTGYEPVTPTATIGTTPVAEASISGTTAYAIYEVVYADPTVQESLSIPFAVAFFTQPATGSVRATTSLAPLNSNGADQTSPVPRFTNLSTGQNAYSIAKCATP